MKPSSSASLILAIFLSAVPFRVHGHELELGRFNRSLVSREAVDRVDELASKGLEREFEFFEESRVRSSLDELAERLRSAPGNARYLEGLEFSTSVLSGPRINAFTTPNGRLVFGGRLLLELASEDHVMAIMAHEMAHVSRAHIYRRVDRILQFGHEIETAESRMMKVLLGGHRFFDVQHLSRAFEFEADQIAMELLDNAGVNPMRVPESLQKLEQAVGKVSGEVPAVRRPSWARRGFNFVETHPLTYHRIQSAERELLDHGYRRAIEPVQENSSRFNELLKALRRHEWRFRF